MSDSIKMWGVVMSALLSGVAMCVNAQAPTADSAQAAEHVRRATELAGTDLRAPLFLCRPDSTTVVKENLESGMKQWLEPVALADNLYYLGNRFVGVLVLRTARGLILFDSSNSEEEAREHLVPGLLKLGLDPTAIKYVVVTHGHWDHYGGAKYLQDTYRAHVALSAADWDLIEKLPANSLEASNHPIPTRDVVVHDSERLSLGGTRITLYLTPGHTPGTVSAIVPVKSKGKTHYLSLFGSVAFPPTFGPTERTGGLREYDASVLRFDQVSAAASAEGILNTHIFADGTYDRIQKLTPNSSNTSNPFLTGKDFTHRYYGILHECLQAALLRPEGINDWSKPLTPAPATSRSVEP